MHSTHGRLRLASALAFALSMTACGGDDDSAPEPLPGPLACSALGTWLQGQPNVKEASATLTATGANARCELNFIWSARSGTEAGYAAGEAQRVALRVGLPLSALDGGTGGLQGAWNGKVRNLGGGGLVGAVGNVTNATSTGYVGSSTDSGHATTENPGFGVIQATRELNRGKIEDFFSESLKQQYQWALKLSQVYYGRKAERNYWDGCSTGGRQGLVLALKHGEDFHGFLLGAPHTSHTRTSATSTWRQWINKDVAGGSVTLEKQTAAVNSAIAACDGLDGVVDGLVNDPRQCTYDARGNICGQPGAPAAPACLTEPEASAINQVWDGARNDKGVRLWPSGGRTAVNSMVVGDNCGPNGVMCWIQKDMTSDWRTRPLAEFDDLLQVGTNTLAPLIDMRDPNLDRARGNGAKILMWHGGSDPLINWQQSTWYYRNVAQHYGGIDKVKDWFRFFLAPGVGHCSGGVGPNPVSPFDQMVRWSETGIAPDTIPAARAATQSTPARTRPLCAWPTTAIYKGSGSIEDAANFTCGGNLDTRETICQNYRIAPFQNETAAIFDNSLLDSPEQCNGIR